MAFILVVRRQSKPVRIGKTFKNNLVDTADSIQMIYAADHTCSAFGPCKSACYRILYNLLPVGDVSSKFVLIVIN